MKKPVLQTVFQIVFLLVVGAASMLIALGLRFDFSQLRTWEYWGRVLGNMVASQIIYDCVFSMDQRNRRSDPNGNYYRTLASTKIKIRRIEQDKRYEDLDKAVAEENRERYEKACNRILHRITSRLSFSDINPDAINEKYIEEIAIRYKLTKKNKKGFEVLTRQGKKLRKAMYKIARGKVHYSEMTADDILRDEELEKVGKVDMHVNYKALAAKRNIIKAVSFLVLSAIMASIGYSFQRPDFWPVLIMNASLFIGAAVSGITQSFSHARFRTAVYEVRNEFLRKRMNIMDEYVQE